MSTRIATIVALALALAIAGLYTGSGSLLGFGSGGSNGCSLSELEGEGSALPVRAECDWPIPAERLHALIASFDEHDVYFSNLGESTMLADEGDRARVRQVHQAPGISDREVVVQWEVASVDGGTRYSWRKSADQSEMSGRGIEVQDYSGVWQVTATETGSHVVFETRYAPGGRVPFFLVRWFQGSGIRQVLSELHDAAEANVQVASGPEL